MEAQLIKLNPELLALIHNNGGADIMPFKQEIFVLNEYVAGTGYCEGIEEIVPHLAEGMYLTMRRHPDNKVDEYANCKVVRVEPHDKWPKINVSIYMID